MNKIFFKKKNGYGPPFGVGEIKVVSYKKNGGVGDLKIGTYTKFYNDNYKPKMGRVWVSLCYRKNKSLKLN